MLPAVPSRRLRGSASAAGLLCAVLAVCTACGVPVQMLLVKLYAGLCKHLLGDAGICINTDSARPMLQTGVSRARVTLGTVMPSSPGLIDVWRCFRFNR